jgi:DnaK suppressor protein
MKASKTKRSRGSKSQWAALRKRLVRRRQELLDQMQGELDDSRERATGARFDDVADRASDILYNELAQGFAEIASADLKMIERAIEKMDEGNYGLCEGCGGRIPQARLRALPFAALCVECKREEEAEGGWEAPPIARPINVRKA